MARAKIDLPDVPEIPLPRIDVLERSIQNPLGLPATKIELKDPQFVCHWCNTELKGGTQLHYFTEHGYLKVRPAYLKDPEGFQWNPSPEGFVVRGPRGQEILMYTTVQHAKARVRAKTEENLRRMRRTNAEMVEAAGEKFGDEAADFLQRRTRAVGGVHDQIEVMERRDEAEE